MIPCFEILNSIGNKGSSLLEVVQTGNTDLTMGLRKVYQ